MRRLLLLPLLVVVAVLAVGIAVLIGRAHGSVGDVQKSAQAVRTAIPPIEAYAADNRGSYLGVTIAKIRRWDYRIRNIAILDATKDGYCVETTTKPFAHFAGPLGEVREGRCGEAGAVIPFVPPPPPPQPSAEVARAQELLRHAVPAIEGFSVDHGGYRRMTIAKIRAYDAGVRKIKIVWAERNRFCIETTSEPTHHLLGPAEGAKRGSCPPARG